MVIASADLEKVMVSDFWPLGVECRQWSIRLQKKEETSKQNWNKHKYIENTSDDGQDKQETSISEE